ncbi:Nucleoside-diphosphate-sugar epimerase [Agreia bicolorata]|uniref:Nucleoside-diphosphate-sugar epimerase n=1 Tax=Agreia bicolorata TaxID=110935 RepID=A0A1T4XW48_9MICO|nr:NAD-dependent epimerase/dehydratase family protein [Agreia bicolorata]SKA93766.1 Nucleoside-diphosphate-sugar epimerase [Agreia bicolorata]
MKALVTGAAGFVGSTLSRTLLRQGHSVLALDNLSNYYDRPLKRQNVDSYSGLPGCTFIEADLNMVDLDDLLSGGIDVVFHLAGQPGIRGSWGQEFTTYTRANVDATQRLLEACMRYGKLRRFVYASSSSVYGQAETYPTSETTLPRPFSPYGVTKLAGEHLTGLYRANYGVPTVAFRFFTVYGPAQRPDMAFTRFLRAAVSGTPISIYGSGEQVRDFTFVDDIVTALILSAQSNGVLPPVMNLSGGSSVSVNAVLDTIKRISGNELLVDYTSPVKGDVTRTGGDSSLALSELGWAPETPLSEGLRRHLEWVLATQ